MALLGGTSVGNRSTLRRGKAQGPALRGVNVAMGALLAVAMLGGCEYAGTDPLPEASSSAAPSVPPLTGISEEEAARQSELMAEVDALMGPQPDTHFFGFAGGMRGGSGISSMGLVPDAGNYPVHAACVEGPGATLTIRQDGAVLLTQTLECGTPYNAVVQLRAGEVSAALEPIGDGLVGGAARLEAPLERNLSPGVPRN
jgi:hypothetical protein